MKRETCGTIGWGVVAATVAAWDFLAPETLSSAFERGLDNRYTRPLVLGALAVTGAHLTGMLPDRCDPFDLILSLKQEKTALTDGSI